MVTSTTPIASKQPEPPSSSPVLKRKAPAPPSKTGERKTFVIEHNDMCVSNVNRLVGVVVEDTAIGVGGLRFGSWAGQIGRSVANARPPLRRFFGVGLSNVQALSSGDGPAIRCTLRRNTASTMKI